MILWVFFVVFNLLNVFKVGLIIFFSDFDIFLKMRLVWYVFMKSKFYILIFFVEYRFF